MRDTCSRYCTLTQRKRDVTRYGRSGQSCGSSSWSWWPLLGSVALSCLAWAVLSWSGLHVMSVWSDVIKSLILMSMSYSIHTLRCCLVLNGNLVAAVPCRFLALRHSSDSMPSFPMGWTRGEGWMWVCVSTEKKIVSRRPTRNIEPSSVNSAGSSLRRTTATGHPKPAFAPQKPCQRHCAYYAEQA